VAIFYSIKMPTYREVMTAKKQKAAGKAARAIPETRAARFKDEQKIILRRLFREQKDLSREQRGLHPIKRT